MISILQFDLTSETPRFPNLPISLYSVYLTGLRLLIHLGECLSIDSSHAKLKTRTWMHDVNLEVISKTRVKEQGD